MLCLKEPTDSAWAKEAVGRMDSILVDHAHCEMKAASNALSLAARHSTDLSLVLALSEIAAEEVTHFQQVVALLKKRGLALGNPPVDTYAARLRNIAGATPRDPALGPFIDRLLVGALIEARSCERFKLLTEALAAADPDGELCAFYKGLLASEARHYRTFVDLAVSVANGDRQRVEHRLSVLADGEARMVRALGQEAYRATVHG